MPLTSRANKVNVPRHTGRRSESPPYALVICIVRFRDRSQLRSRRSWRRFVSRHSSVVFGNDRVARVVGAKEQGGESEG